MRKLIGCLVLIAGVGGLGYVAMTQDALRIQSQIAVSASALAGQAPHGLDAVVSGRDVVVSGLVTDAGQADLWRDRFSQIDGVRVVDMGAVQMLPFADPFEISVQMDVNGTMTVSGVTPSEAARGDLAEATTADLSGLTLSSGVPDDQWVGAVQSGIAAVAALTSGDMRVSNREIVLNGVAETPDRRAAALDHLAILPEGYGLISDIEVLDDGAPLRLAVSLGDGGVEAFGKLPADMDPSDISDRFALGAQLEVTQSRLPSFDPNWPDVARTGMGALALLIEGEFTLDETGLTLNGVGSPDGIAEAETMLAAVPAPYNVTTDLGVFGADIPFVLLMEWDGQSSRAAGTYPAGFTPRGPAGGTVEDRGEVMFLPDDDGAFTGNADAGVAALGLLNSGSLQVSEDEIALSGIATSPQVGVVIDDVLSGLAETTTITRNLTYLDDGSPASFVLDFDAATGGTVEGRLPNGLALGDLARALGLPDLTGAPVVAVEDDSIGSALEALGVVAPYMPETETLSFAFENGASALDLVMSPGVDLGLVAGELAANLPADVAFSLSPLEVFPDQDTRRVHLASGLNQRFSDGFWLPDDVFEVDLPSCQARSAAVLNNATIGFVSGSDRLDATSIRVINGVAAVAIPCAQQGITLEVGGHTDATGDVLDNDALSQARADAVRSALIARGVPQQAVTAFGFGQNQPIADNDTAEGRAANRRIDITWFAPGALRDP